MGNIAGKYDAKEAGFVPGASSLHSTMTPHGPEAEVFDRASTADLKPTLISPGGMAFMMETCFLLKLTKYAAALQIENSFSIIENSSFQNLHSR